VKFLPDHDVPDDAACSLETLGHVVVKLREALPPTTRSFPGGTGFIQCKQ
jgi:hypothetical protein